MSEAPQPLPSATRPVRPELAAVIRSLKPGQRIRVTQTVRMNCRVSWQTRPIEGVFRTVNFLATGLSTSRVPEDDIVVVCVHFTKDNGELSSITLDEFSQIEALGGAAHGGQQESTPVTPPRPPAHVRP